tara:strand:+ start:963 stop:1424 length:462 start_codon:yes stop_codon:yes gene_type:complete
MSLKDLFEITKQGAKDFRERNPVGDGKVFWQDLKTYIEKTQIHTPDDVNFIVLESETTQNIMLLVEYVTNSFGIQFMNEYNHFLIQTVRIPNNEEISLKKLLQIAFNIGQFLGISGELEMLPRTQLDEFISEENIEKIDISSFDFEIYKNLFK